MKPKLSLIIALSAALLSPSAIAADLDTAKIDEITGLKGKLNQPEGVYKVSYPRDDVKVSVDGWRMHPSWA